MASKRIKKKRLKQKEAEILSAKYSPKEIKNLGAQTRKKEAKRTARNEKRKADRAESKQFLLNQGLDQKFISKYKLYDKQAKSYDSRELLKLKKQNVLENAGIKFKQSDLKLGWVKLQERYPQIIIPDNAWKHPPKGETNGFKYWLYVGAAAAGNDGFEPMGFDNFTIEDFETHINMIINHAKKHPDGSGKMHCVFQVRITDNQADANHAAQVFYGRGYNLDIDAMKLDSKSYSVLTVSNKWNKREFLNMVCSCVSQMKNADVTPFISTMKKYCRINGVNWMKNID